MEQGTDLTKSARIQAAAVSALKHTSVGAQFIAPTPAFKELKRNSNKT